MAEQSKGYLLVVDDNEMNCDMLSRRLQRRGYKVKVALNGYQALDFLKRETFDMILLDIMMPGISGIDVLRQVRATYSLTELPILMTTAKRDNESVVEALKLGANDYLTKPFDFQVVLARIETQLSIKSQMRRRTGSGLFKVRNLSRKDELTADVFCPECQTALRSGIGSCGRCHTPRPQYGWPRIADSDLPFLGQVIGDRYFMEQYLSSGTTGDVYRCRDLELSRVFAAKIIDISLDTTGMREDDLRARIKMEVEAMVRLQNPHVVKIYEVLQVRRNVYALVMDFVRGKNLGDILEESGPFDPVNALRITRQVAQGLYEAHQLGMIHRDIKPENIMVEKLPAGGYFAQILDFGIVILLDRPGSSDRYFGTPLYTSPEQVQQQIEVDHRADIYALGAVLYHILTGDPPYESEDVMRILAQHVGSPIPKLGDRLEAESYQEAMDKLIARMMAKTREERFQSLREVIEQIDELLPIVSYHKSSVKAVTGVKTPGFTPKAKQTLDLPPIDQIQLVVDSQRPRVSGLFKAVEYTFTGSRFPLIHGDSAALLLEQKGSATQVSHIDFRTAKVADWLQVPDAETSAIAVSPCGRFLAVADDTSNRIRVFGTRSKQELSSWSLSARDLVALAIAEEGRLIAAGTRRGALYVIDNWGDEQPLLVAQRGPAIETLAFTPLENELVIGREDKTLELLALTEDGLNGVLASLDSKPICSAFDPEGILGAVLTEQGFVHCFTYSEELKAAGRHKVAALQAISFDETQRLIGLQHKSNSWQLLDLQQLIQLDNEPSS